MTLPPRFRLAALPTPLVRADRLETALRSPPLYVKRDDLTGFALGGNKVRKLEYAIGEARARSCDMLLTGGGPRSNHCRAAAAAARVAGLGCTVVLYGEEPVPAPVNLTLIRALGANVRFTGDPDRSSVDVALENIMAELEVDGRDPYLVPRGGASPTGAAGYAVAAFELGRQLDEREVESPAVAVAVGSCGTYAGLLAGAAVEGRSWRLIGATVSRPPEECRRRIATLAGAAADLMGASPPEPERIEIVDARGPGYGRPSEEGWEMADLAARTEGLFLDPIFTAKALGALVRLFREGLEEPTVFVHTGGEVEATTAWTRGTSNADE